MRSVPQPVSLWRIVPVSPPVALRSGAKESLYIGSLLAFNHRKVPDIRLGRFPVFHTVMPSSHYTAIYSIHCTVYRSILCILISNTVPVF